MSDHPRDCPHGRQWGKCDTCDLIEANKHIAALEHVLRLEIEAENASFRALVEAHEEVKAQLKAENERLRAVVEAAKEVMLSVLPFLPDGRGFTVNHQDDPDMRCGDWCWDELCSACQDSVKVARSNVEAALAALAALEVGDA